VITGLAVNGSAKLNLVTRQDFSLATRGKGLLIDKCAVGGLEVLEENIGLIWHVSDSWRWTAWKRA